eukprot:1856913-Amphidinium_carterae.1
MNIKLPNPTMFDGKPPQFNEWSEEVKSYLTVRNIFIDDLMDDSCRSTTPMVIATMEERDDPEGTFWRRSQLEGHQHAIEEAYRGEQGRDRQERRQERSQIRFKGTKEELQKMRDALREIIITARWERLERRRYPAPKAPPQGIRQ